MCPIIIDHRPKTFDEVIGNKHLVSILRSMAERERKSPGKISRAILLHGRSGCGKTTFARLFAKEVGCSTCNIIEVDVSDNRGIDAVREIKRGARYKPIIGGEKKAYILDECFAKGTKVQTPNGEIKIENIKKGDLIYSLAGKSEVEFVFNNRVDLNRVCRMKLSNGQVVYTTVDHLFLTQDGWIKAKDLKNKGLLYSYSCDIMNNIDLQNNSQGENYVNMPILSNKFQEQKSKSKTKNLLSFMCDEIKKFTIRIWIDGNSILQILQQKNESSQISNKSMLQSFLCKKNGLSQDWIQRKSIYSRTSEKIIYANESIYQKQSREIKKNISSDIRENEKRQSYEFKDSSRKGINDKKNQWNIICLEGSKGRKWNIDRGAKAISDSSWMGDGICSFFRRAKDWISDLLQNRCCKSKIKNWNRGRWEAAFHEKNYKERFEKNKNVAEIRMENIEIYQQGNNDESFIDIIKDKERNQGYVIFYDLQVSRHPSYFANNCVVHNCHGTTSEAQNALLKILEEPPSHVFFLLCTTAPEKLLETIKNRCKKLKVKPLNDRQMERLITGVAGKENIKLPGNIIDKIISNVDGCPRQALDTLDTIRGLENKDIEKAISDFSISAPVEIINLCRAIIKGEKWNVVRKLLEEIKDVDVENVRRQILGYLTSSIKNSDKPSRQMIIAADAFREPYFHNGKAGLILSAYEAVVL